MDPQSNTRFMDPLERVIRAHIGPQSRTPHEFLVGIGFATVLGARSPARGFVAALTAAVFGGLRTIGATTVSTAPGRALPPTPPALPAGTREVAQQLASDC